MKKRSVKRIISLAVAVLIVCSLSAAAMADMYTVKVKVKAGDNLTGICARYGVTFRDCKDMIMRLNGFTDPAQLDRIKAGQTIEIPASANDAAALNDAAGLQTTGASAAACGPVQIVAGDAAKAPAGDRAAFYVVLYTIRSGDILANLYTQWGSELGTYQCQMISALNGMSDLGKLVVDKMIYLPVNRNDIPGMAHYTVFEHTIANGENVSSICSRYGLDFGSARACLQCFNPNMDFNAVQGGNKLYIPTTGAVQTAAAAPTVSIQYAGQYGETAALATAADARVTDITSNGPVGIDTPAPGTIPALGLLRGDPSPLSPTELYDGYAVVKSCDGALTLQLEKADVDVNVAYTQQTLQGYSPRPGDYVKVVYTPTDFLLVSIQYIYNVFTGA